MQRVLFYWYCLARPLLMRVGAVLCGVLTCFVILAQSSILFGASAPGKLLASLVQRKRKDTNNSPMFQFFLFVPLIYTTLCAFHTVFEMRIWKFYQFFGHRQTDATSLLMNAYILLRFMPGLCFSFMLVLHETTINSDEPYPPTAFSKLIAAMDMGPLPSLAKAFNVIAPLVLILFTLLFATDAIKKLLKLLGITRFESEAAFDPTLCEQGQQLINRVRSGSRGPAPPSRSSRPSQVISSAAAAAASARERLGKSTSVTVTKPKRGLNEPVPVDLDQVPSKVVVHKPSAPPRKGQPIVPGSKREKWQQMSDEESDGGKNKTPKASLTSVEEKLRSVLAPKKEPVSLRSEEAIRIRAKYTSQRNRASDPLDDL
eukprot:c16457_g1_i3.p1 GENE.c16457_g1_i3~~c16457_g1_i3.p1  ORF type:complete len:372 (+),score=88.07 c16457_g1_i3:216-1331(+)